MTTPLLENILNQPQALETIAERQFGEGREALEKAVELLRSKKRVLLSGMGASLFACQGFQYQLTRRGVNAVAVETAELLYFTPTLFDGDTAAILISRSGESVEVTKFLPRLRERKATTIGVVNMTGSALAAGSDVALVLGSPADQMVAIQTYIGTVALLALLGAGLESKLDEARDELLETAAVLRQVIPASVAERAATWDELLDTEWPLYILGRGASLGTVAEGALVMQETAKSPAVGMSVAQFRHGPVEVVDDRFRGVVLGTHQETAGLDEALVDDLGAMGARARLLKPPAVPERFTSVAEIVPLQIAAYRKAELNGVRPGDFRWAPLVTASETGFNTSGAR